jgi:hypothetical protein
MTEIRSRVEMAGEVDELAETRGLIGDAELTLDQVQSPHSLGLSKADANAQRIAIAQAAGTVALAKAIVLLVEASRSDASSD